MKLSLVVATTGKMEGKAIQINLPQFLIGRDQRCHLRPSSPTISNRHCALFIKDERAYVRDLNSTNGTFLNDVPVTAEVEIHEGDKLRLGPLVFKIAIAKDAPIAQPVAAAKNSNASDNNDDLAASLLLALGDDAPVSADPTNGPENAAAVDTLMMKAPGLDTVKNEGKPGESKPEDPKSKYDTAKQAEANTSTAASAILNKYLRRR